MNTRSETRAQLSGHTLTIARICWIVFALTLTLLHIWSQIAVLQLLPGSNLAPSQLLALQAMGLTAPTFNLLRFVWTVPNALVWGGLGLLIFLRKSNERSALIISALMVGIGMAAEIPPWEGFAAAFPAGYGWFQLRRLSETCALVPSFLFSQQGVSSRAGRLRSQWEPAFTTS